MKNFCIRTAFLLCTVLPVLEAFAQERVYVSTDKECYLAGEDLWLSVYCMEGDRLSKFSKVAYVEFHSLEGVAAYVKLPLKDGRGCGRLQIPLVMATGNYTIVAYTSHYGGDSVNEFDGKVVSVFNTLQGIRVKDGVEVVEGDASVEGNGLVSGGCNWLSVDVQTGAGDGEMIPVQVKNLSGRDAKFSVSIYHLDPLTRMVGVQGYNRTPLLERKGDFKEGSEPDYAGEVIKVKIAGSGEQVPASGKWVYLSAVGNTDDVYINTVDSAGCVTFYTNNIYGTRDLVVEIEGDTSNRYPVEILQHKYSHKCVPPPVLRISPGMKEALEARSMDMQIAKRFEADTVFNLMERRENSFFGQVKPVVYKLDDYTRFPVMSEVIREYVKDLRIRKEGNETVMRLLWATKARALVLLDGVPVTDHSVVVGMDPLLVKEIVLYSRRYVLNNRIYDGVVKFNTYKGDLGGVKFAKNVNIVNYRGVQYPLAFLSDNALASGNYPNFNNTIYWNPLCEVKAGESLLLHCAKPLYKGEFRMVIEGMDSEGKSISWSTSFKVD